jgi:hypothetical protein
MVIALMPNVAAMETAPKALVDLGEVSTATMVGALSNQPNT